MEFGRGLSCILSLVWLVGTTQAQPTTAPFVQAQISQGPPLPSGRGCAAAGWVDGKVVVAGGSNWSADRTTKHFLQDTLIYDQNCWTAGPSMPRPMAEGMFASDGQALYVAGGLRAINTPDIGVFCLVKENGQWTWRTLPELPVPISAGAAVIHNGMLYVACGQTNDQPSAALYRLDLKSPEKWVQCASLPGNPRLYCAMVSAGDALYLLGGCQLPKGDLPMEVYSDLWQYLPDQDQWHRLNDLPAAGYGWCASPVNGHRILITGRVEGVAHDDLWLVDLQQSWVRTLGRDVLGVSCASLVRVDPDTWWLIGGEPNIAKTRTPKITVIRLK